MFNERTVFLQIPLRSCMWKNMPKQCLIIRQFCTGHVRIFGSQWNPESTYFVGWNHPAPQETHSQVWGPNMLHFSYEYCISIASDFAFKMLKGTGKWKTRLDFLADHKWFAHGFIQCAKTSFKKTQDSSPAEIRPAPLRPWPPITWTPWRMARLGPWKRQFQAGKASLAFCELSFWLNIYLFGSCLGQHFL